MESHKTANLQTPTQLLCQVEKDFKESKLQPNVTPAAEEKARGVCFINAVKTQQF